jgi:hypothetical protein
MRLSEYFCLKKRMDIAYSLLKVTAKQQQSVPHLHDAEMSKTLNR